MKKILFVCYGLGIGGIEKCLVNLINALPEDQFDIDVLLMNPEYDLQTQIKRKVNYIDRFNYVMNTTDTMGEIKAHGGIVTHPVVFIRYCIFRLSIKFKRNPCKIFRQLPQEYDVAVSYSHHDFSPCYVIEKVKAKRKVMWYHNGSYNKTAKGIDKDKKNYSQFDYIVAVSDDCARVLQRNFQFEDSKLIVLRNICDIDFIISQADAFMPSSYSTGVLHITTVGRLTPEKGADVAVNVCKKLIEQNYKICWHWVGDGNQKEAISKQILEKGLKSTFILEGNQSNPYPYIKCCDIYVQPSYYEAYSTTITEAKVLKKPIVTSDVGGMRDQIEDGINGFIVPVDNVNDLADRIALLIENKKIRESFSSELETNSVDNKKSLSKYYQTVFE